MAFEALLAARGRVRIQLGGRASGMRQKDTGTPKKKTRRAAGQMVASAVMALAIAVGGFGTTALLASQPAGLTSPLLPSHSPGYSARFLKTLL